MSKATFPETTGFESSTPGATQSQTDMQNVLSALFQMDFAPLRAKAQDTPDLTVAVNASQLNSFDQKVWLGTSNPDTYAGGNSPALVAPVSNPRIDILVLNTGGTLEWVAGTEAGSPVPDWASIPSGGIPLALVYCKTTMDRVLDYDDKDTDATEGYIYGDCRPFLNLGGGGASSEELNALKDNVALLSFQIATQNSLTLFGMVDAFVDTYEDETGVDTTASANETWNEAGAYYAPSKTDETTGGTALSSGDSEDADLIPLMTDYSAPSGTASGSTEYSTAEHWWAFSDKVQGNMNLTGTSGYLQYQFATAQIVTKYTIEVNVVGRAPYDWTFEASNTGAFTGEEVVLDTVVADTSWTTLVAKEYTFANTTAYLYYRIAFTDSGGASGITQFHDVQFISEDVKANAFDDDTATKWTSATDLLVNLCPVHTENASPHTNEIPDMTSNNAPSGVASASSELSATYYAWKAFDRLNTSSWLTNGTTTGWLKYDFGSGNEKTLIAYTLMGESVSNLNNSFKTWTFEGSNDDAVWDVLDTQTSVDAWINDEVRAYTFSNTTAYRYYRWNVTENHGGTRVGTETVTVSETEINIATAISSYSATYYPWKAFDNSASTSWMSGNSTTAGWIKYEFGNAKTITKYVIGAEGISAIGHSFITWTLEGSNNDSDWTVLDTQTSVPNWSIGETRTYEFVNATAYKYYKMDVTEIQGGTRLGTITWELYGLDEIYIGYDFGSAKTMKDFSITQASAGQAVTSVKIQASTDNATWVDIATQALLADTSKQQHPFTNSTGYRYWRLLANSSTTDGDWSVSEVEFFETALNMTLISEEQTALAEPDTGRIVLFKEDIDAVTLNTDLKVYLTKNNGTDWDEVTLTDSGDYASGKDILTGEISLSGTGTDMAYKVVTANNKDVRIHGAQMSWQ